MNCSLILTLACLLSLPAFAESPAEKKARLEAEAEVAAEKASRPTLGVTAEEAVIKANAIAKARKVDFAFKLHKQSDDSVQYTVRDPEKLVLQFIGKKGSKPISAFVIARSEGAPEDGAMILNAIVLTIRGVDPQVSQEKAGQIAVELVKAAANKETGRAQGIACTFSASSSPQVGFMFTVDPVKKGNS